jgi:hypothetical protein
MKKITIVFAFLMMSAFIFAQGEAPLAKGEKQMNFGIGFGSGIPLYWGMEWAVHPDITVGGVAAINLQNFDWMSLNAKGDYHWNRLIGIPSNFDFYAGVGLGVQIGFNGGSTGFDFDIHAGGRWYWSEKWGLNLEIGGGNGFGTTLGVTMKM